MKKVLLLVVVMTTAMASAQFEAKINPLGALFGRPEVSGEYIVSDNFGVELSLGVAFGKTGTSVSSGEFSSEKPTQSGFGVKLGGKYYFSPDQGGDGWYGGLYLRQESLNISYDDDYSDYDYKSSIFAGGIEFGKKWVFDSGFLIDLSAGVGRPFSENREWTNVDGDYDASIELGVDFVGKFALGYRFL
jgi:opacity protein-like surface antigen